MAKKPAVMSSVDALLDQELDAAEKKFGISTTLVDPDETKLSTGLLAVDLITFGGLRSGGWYTVFGPEQSCKSTMATTLAGSLMKQEFHKHGRGVFWDAEGSTDPDYMSNIFEQQGFRFDYGDLFGIKSEDGSWLKRGAFRFYQEDDGETFFDIMNKVKRVLPRVTKIDNKYYYEYPKSKENDARWKNKAVEKLSKDKFWLVPCDEDYKGQPQCVTLLDSYPSLLPEAMDKDEASGAIGQQARMFADGIKRVKGGMRRRKMVLIGVNQIRERPMVMFGSPTYEPCGNALKFYSDVRLKMTPRALPSGWEGKGMVMQEASALGEGNDAYRFICIKAEKNKLGGLPYQESWLRLWITDANGQARGFDPVYDTFYYLKTLGYMSGTRNNMKFAGCRLAKVKKGAKIDWMTFKKLVIGTDTEKREICEKLDIKPFDLRKWCFADLQSGRGLDRFRRSLVGKSNDGLEDGDGETSPSKSKTTKKTTRKSTAKKTTRSKK